MIASHLLYESPRVESDGVHPSGRAGHSAQVS